jgi:hypothetical protein
MMAIALLEKWDRSIMVTKRGAEIDLDWLTFTEPALITVPSVFVGVVVIIA